MARNYSGASTAALRKFTTRPEEDGSTVYTFPEINMQNIKNSIGNSFNFDIEIRSKVKKQDNEGNLLWLWITLPIVGVLAIAGGILAFFLVRRRNLKLRLGGGQNGGNTTKEKVKKTKAKEIDYRDYYN